MRPCSICARPDITRLNEMLAEPGRSERGIAAELGISRASLQRHAARHLPSRAISGQPSQIEPLAPGADPIEELVSSLRVRALAGDPTAMREYRLSLTAQSQVRLAEARPRRVVDEPEWIRLRSAILAALQPFPEARRALADAVRALAASEGAA